MAVKGKMSHRQTIKMLRWQYQNYPNLKTEDMLKALYQSEFGPEHFITEPDACFKILKQEAASCEKRKTGELIEAIGEGFGRVHLGLLDTYGLSIETLFKIFLLSAEKPHGSMPHFRRKLKCLERMTELQGIPFDRNEVHRKCIAYKRSGYPALHHSDEFKREYAPSYRVITKELCNLIPLLCHIDVLLQERNRVIVAIDGNCAAGKTTLADTLSKIYDCNVFHMDSFFLQKHQRSKDRLSEIGGNVDYVRIYTEVLKPVFDGRPFSYSAYDCRTQKMSDPKYVEPKKLNIVEGAYSMHTELADNYDFSVFLNIDRYLQSVRIMKRNGIKMFWRFNKEWIPMENRYFKGMNVRERCDIVFQAKQEALVPRIEETDK